MHSCDMTHSYVRHDSLNCETWLIDSWDMAAPCVTCLIHMCDMTHSYVWYDAFICLTQLIHIRDMTESYVWHDSPIPVLYSTHLPRSRIHIWLTHTYEMSYSYVSFISATRLIQWMSDLNMTHSLLWNAVLRYDSLTHMKCHIYIWLTHTYETLCSYVCVACLIHFWDMWFMHRCDTHYQ